MAKGLGTRMLQFIKQGDRISHWEWIGPRDRHGKPMAFANQTKVNLDPAEAIYKKFRKTKKCMGGNGKIVRLCGVEDCMNPWHMKFVGHRSKQLRNSVRHRTLKRKEEPFVFAMQYLRFAERHENKNYGQTLAAEKAKKEDYVAPTPNCPVCKWPEPICACYQPD